MVYWVDTKEKAVTGMRMVWESSGVRFIREMVSVYFDRRVSRSAAELAYFLVLSFFPVLICVNAFVGLLRLDVNLVLEAAEGILPQEVLPILGEYLGYITINQSNTLLFAGLTMVLFSASAAFRALMNIMADIYERPTYQGVGQVVASVLFSVLFLVTIYLSIAVLLTGSWMSYSAPFPGKEWKLTAHYFATGQLKFDPEFLYKTYPMSQAAEAFQEFHHPQQVHGKIMLVNE